MLTPELRGSLDYFQGYHRHEAEIWISLSCVTETHRCNTTTAKLACVSSCAESVPSTLSQNYLTKEKKFPLTSSFGSSSLECIFYCCIFYCFYCCWNHAIFHLSSTAVTSLGPYTLHHTVSCNVFSLMVAICGRSNLASVLWDVSQTREYIVMIIVANSSLRYLLAMIILKVIL